MRIVAVCNRYLHRGGEDEVFESDVALLLSAGHEVVPVTAHNEVPEGLLGRARFAVDAVWSSRWRRRMADLLSAFRPDLVHVVNFFPRFSPSIYYACVESGVPVVQTVQNYRLTCPRATLFRDGAVCEQCLGRAVPWPGVLHACYHDSRLQTAVVGSMTSVHRALGTFRDRVRLYVAATEFSRHKLIEGGLPAERVVRRANFRMVDPGPRGEMADGVLFVGRLSQEKGIETLLEAWRGLDVPLRIAGDGPLEAECREAGRANPSIEYLGRVENPRVVEEMKHARFLIFPSLWYEGFPMTIIEAFACGLPVLGSRLGAMAEVIEEGRNGWLFDAGVPESLRARVEELSSQPRAVREAGIEARRDYEERYTPEVGLTRLLEIYEIALSD